MRALVFLLVPLLLAASPAPDIVVRLSAHDLSTLADRVAEAAEARNLVIVGRASASAAARGRGITIPGDIVLMVFNNRFAVRVLAASQEAGLEPPLHLHVFETPDGHAALSYRLPSAVFRPYASPALDAIAAELDSLFAEISAKAVGP